MSVSQYNINISQCKEASALRGQLSMTFPIKGHLKSK